MYLLPDDAVLDLWSHPTSEPHLQHYMPMCFPGATCQCTCAWTSAACTRIHLQHIWMMLIVSAGICRLVFIEDGTAICGIVIYHDDDPAHRMPLDAPVQLTSDVVDICTQVSHRHMCSRSKRLKHSCMPAFACNPVCSGIHLPHT